MSKIYEAIEHARRRQAGSAPALPTPQAQKDTPPTSDFDFDMEKEMLDLYSSIASLLPDLGGKVVQFIGSREGEGTSTLIREFARVLSVQFNKSVFLLDADLCQVDQGVSSTRHQEHSLELVVQESDLIVEASHELVDSRFFVCPVSTFGASPAAVLDSPHLNSFFEKLKQQFDFILVDSPPVSVSAIGLALVHKVDGVVLVVEAEKTRWPVARRAKERIIKAQGNILGIIFNKRRYYIPSFIYKRL